MKIYEKEVNIISIIDDSEQAREMYELPMEELDITPHSVAGPIEDLKTFVTETVKISQAAICDHHLKVGSYAHFDGAELVANWYTQKFPAILCSRYDEASIDEMRKFRKNIPVLIKPAELDPHMIVTGIEKCIAEFKEIFQPSRKAWRSLIRVEDIDKESNKKNPYVYVTIPSWNNNTVIRLMMLDLPKGVQDRISMGVRFHAHVNIGAESQSELYFDQWELA